FVREILPQVKERGLQKFAARLEAGVDTVNLALLETKKRPAPSAEEEQYKVENNRIWYRGLGGWQPLCNFAATITEEVIRDDGAEEKGELLVAGRLQSGRPLSVA